jgi:hypothetical protein
MSNLITKYKDFLFEADNLQIEIDTAELELSKEEKKLVEIKEKFDNDTTSAGKDESKKLQAKANYLAEKAASYGRMIPLLNSLKDKIGQKASSVKA